MSIQLLSSHHPISCIHHFLSYLRSLYDQKISDPMSDFCHLSQMIEQYNYTISTISMSRLFSSFLKKSEYFFRIGEKPRHSGAFLHFYYSVSTVSKGVTSVCSSSGSSRSFMVVTADLRLVLQLLVLHHQERQQIYWTPNLVQSWSNTPNQSPDLKNDLFLWK